MSQLTDCGDSCGPFALEQRMELGVCTPTVWGSLEGCESPRILARCLLDCLVAFAQGNLRGYPFPMFISNRNLLRRLGKDAHPHAELASKDIDEDWFHSDDMQFLSKYLNGCSAFVVDDDLPVPLNECHRIGKGIVGTMAFLPTRILNLSMRREPIIFTAIDCLQSFAWVLLWVAFCKDPKHRESEMHLTNLNHKTVRKFANTKHLLMEHIADQAGVLNYPLPVQAIRNLFNRWITASREATIEVSRVLEDERFTFDNLDLSPELRKELSKTLEGATRECLKEYIRAAVDFIEAEGEELTVWSDPSA